MNIVSSIKSIGAAVNCTSSCGTHIYTAGVCPEGPSINEHEQELEGPQREPSAGHNYQVRRAQSEATSSSSPNRHLAEDDAR
jgi:hypothetical protein